ncbi:MAG: serine acetyltransferase [Cephaloticoccus sp.]|nr:serine acetyltransferase [Cephaloticoccus sp.]MCF7759630.1 serine acetyltransferase [Cephaloticoccus sp.]
MKLDDIKQALLESYERDGGINHLDGVNLPTQDSVQQLASDYMHLIFPGFFEASGLTKQDVPNLVEDLLRRVELRLRTDIEKSLRFAREKNATQRAQELTMATLDQLPALRKIIKTDVDAAFAGDPAAGSIEEIILAYPCVLSISLQRFAHVLYTLDVPLLPRMLTEYGHERTGSDLHPGAKIGSHFFIDHGTGVVIGETSEIGTHVKLYQGVALIARSTAGGQALRGQKRHPSIEDRVTVYASTTIMGGDTVIGAGSTIAGNVFVTNTVPKRSLVLMQEQSLKVLNKDARESAEQIDWVI